MIIFTVVTMTVSAVTLVKNYYNYVLKAPLCVSSVSECVVET